MAIIIPCGEPTPLTREGHAYRQSYCQKERGHHDDHFWEDPANPGGASTSWMNYAWGSCTIPGCAPCRSYREYHGIPMPEPHGPTPYEQNESIKNTGLVVCADCSLMYSTYGTGEDRRIYAHACSGDDELVADIVRRLRTRHAIDRDDAMKGAA